MRKSKTCGKKSINNRSVFQIRTNVWHNQISLRKSKKCGEKRIKKNESVLLKLHKESNTDRHTDPRYLPICVIPKGMFAAERYVV